VADSHRAGQVRTRRAHRRPADPRRTPVTSADTVPVIRPAAEAGTGHVPGLHLAM
jgi:hypothetical protein